MTNETTEILAGWAVIERCEAFAEGSELCGRKTTHVIFINTPSKEDWPYAVGCCAKHKDQRFKTVTLHKFMTTVDALIAKGVTHADFPWEIAEILNPIPEEILQEAS